jgi:hypothetical protein
MVKKLRIGGVFVTALPSHPPEKVGDSTFTEECGYLAAQPGRSGRAPIKEREARRLLDEALRRAMVCRSLALRLALELVAQAVPEIAPKSDNPATDRQALRLEKAQPRIDFACLTERIRESMCIPGGLEHAGADMRPRDKGRIADQRDVTARHALAFEIVDRL